MADRAEQQLLGYLLDALDDSEQKQIRKQLASDPSLRHQLGELRKSLRPLEMASQSFSPPEGLARRTCRFIAEYETSSPDLTEAVPIEKVAAASKATQPLAQVEAPAESSSGGWSWRDLAVAAAILVAATLLIFPAIENSRFNAQVVACRDNLRQLGTALAQYSQRHNDYFPPVAIAGQPGSTGDFATTLANLGYLDSPQAVICPASARAVEPQNESPTFEKSSNVAGYSPRQVSGRLTSGYGNCLGFVANGRFFPPKNLNRASYAVMSDVPSERLPGYQSLNHRGRGQNVLFEDLHVQFFTTPHPSGLSDHFFVNDSGQVAPGRHRDDSVIAGSDFIPVSGTRKGPR